MGGNNVKSVLFSRISYVRIEKIEACDTGGTSLRCFGGTKAPPFHRRLPGILRQDVSGGIGMNEVLRQEKKFSINLADSVLLRGYLGAVMHGDAHNGAQGYAIRSLYFDTPDDQDFQDKVDGLELRRKIRLRAYSPSAPFAMLEMKQKQGPYQRKRSLRVFRQDAQRLCRGDYQPLLGYEDPFAAECYGVLHCRCYRPKAVVEYRRQAYVAQENHIRITLDSDIRANEAGWDLFQPDLPLYPVLPPSQLVLEVKYNGFLLSYIKDLLNRVERSEVSVSKYGLARSVSLWGRS